MLKIEFNSMNAHNTISVSMGENKKKIDLYYYCLDYALLEKEQSISKGWFNFFLMLENWRIKIKRIKINQKDFLPFDYSDQYIGFYIIERISNEEVTVQYASTTEFTGWNAAPSQLYTEDLLSKPYKLFYEVFTFDVAILLQEIEAAIENLSDVFYTGKKEK